jgi:hypothetical protein
VSKVDNAYIAGFWEGEGSAYINGRTAHITIVQKDRTALDAIQELLGGIGHIYPRGGEAFRLCITKRSDVRRFIRLIYPHVRSPRRRTQLRVAYHQASRKRRP